MTITKLLKNQFLIFFLMLIFSVFEVNAQVGIRTYFDVGENAVSEGHFLKSAIRGEISLNEYEIESGLQFDLLSSNPNMLSGFDVLGRRKFTVKEFPFDVKLFFLLNRYSDLLNEINWGVRAGTKHFIHWELELGSNSKSYLINKKARERNNIDKAESVVTEAIDLTYLVAYFLKPHENDWNVGLSLTNVDYFLFNQSTNPSFNLLTYYKPCENLKVDLRACYLPVGVFNIYTSYFGYYFRGGVTWEI